MQNIGSLLQFTPQGSYGNRVKVTGTLIYQQPVLRLYLQDEKQGFMFRPEKTPLTPGDRIEVLGFSAQGDYTPVLGKMRSIGKLMAAGTASGWRGPR